MNTYKRRGFLHRSLLSAASIVASWPPSAHFRAAEGAQPDSKPTITSDAPAKLHIEVVDQSEAPVWVRLEVRGPGGKMYQPDLASYSPSSALIFPCIGPWYLGSFVVKGETVVEVPSGTYTIIAEHGPEYERVEEQVMVTAGQAIRLRIRVKPWIRMNAMGWWSADFHVHHPPEEMPKLAHTEDLNLSVVYTIWNSKNLWEGKEWPTNAVMEVDPTHLVTLLNAEDERGGGAWLIQGLQKNLSTAADGRWYPPGIDFIRQARAQRRGTRSEGAQMGPSSFPWFDCEKPFWWETPVVMALETPDSFGLLHNHFTQYGVYPSEVWGRPRDRKEYPGVRGFVHYSLDLYYHYLNLGFMVPPSAGSASGVLPNPIGYNRIYAKLEKPFSVDNWYDAFRNGPSFVTNGPMLFVNTANLPGNEVRVEINACAREPLESIEIVANGQVIEEFLAHEGEQRFQAELTLDGRRHTWVAVRCFGKSESSVRMAHTRPIPVAGTWNSRGDADFFVHWIDELRESAQNASERFRHPEERERVLNLYEQARRLYAGKDV